MNTEHQNRRIDALLAGRRAGEVPEGERIDSAAMLAAATAALAGAAEHWVWSAADLPSDAAIADLLAAAIAYTRAHDQAQLDLNLPRP